MKTNTIFICEKCGEKFESSDKCLEHENICKDNRFLIYRYELAKNERNFVVRLTKYNAKYAEYNKDIVDLIPNGDDPDKFVQIEFDKVLYDDFMEVFYIYTKNVTDKEVYIEKLVNLAEKYFYKKEDEIAEKRKKLLESYVTHDLKYIDDGFVKDNNFYCGD